MMKNFKFLIITFLLFFFSASNGQTLTIRGENGDTLYNNVNNIIDVKAESYLPSQLLVRLNGNEISPNLNLQYNIIIPNHLIGDVIKISVDGITNTGVSNLGERAFYVRSKPGLNLQVGGFRYGDTLTVKQFLEIDSMFFQNNENIILKYACATVPKEGLAEFFNSSNNKISQSLKNSVARLEPGAKILFDEIIFIDSNKERRKASPIILIIK